MGGGGTPQLPIQQNPMAAQIMSGMNRQPMATSSISPSFNQMTPQYNQMIPNVASGIASGVTNSMLNKII